MDDVPVLSFEQIRQASDEIALLVLRAAAGGTLPRTEVLTRIRGIAIGLSLTIDEGGKPRRGYSLTNVQARADSLARIGLLERSVSEPVVFSLTPVGRRAAALVSAARGIAGGRISPEDESDAPMEVINIRASNALEMAADLLGRVAEVRRGEERLLRIRRVN